MRTILTYLILVGIPIVGILGVLQLGSQLEAPASVGGAWKVLPTPQDMENMDCKALFEPGSLMQWMILQSGPWLEIQVDAASQLSLEGELEGTRITASSIDPGSPPLTIQVEAVIDRDVEPDRIYGKITASSCIQPVLIDGVRLSSKASVDN